MIQGFLFGLLFVTFTIGMSYLIGEIIEHREDHLRIKPQDVITATIKSIRRTR
jgi:hypothetical protein